MDVHVKVATERRRGLVDKEREEDLFASLDGPCFTQRCNICYMMSQTQSSDCVLKSVTFGRLFRALLILLRVGVQYGSEYTS